MSSTDTTLSMVAACSLATAVFEEDCDHDSTVQTMSQYKSAIGRRSTAPDATADARFGSTLARMSSAASMGEYTIAAKSTTGHNANDSAASDGCKASNAVTSNAQNASCTRPHASAEAPRKPSR